jgi:multidrug efflux pump subunit AcrA (membrane-fusion protein)
MFGQLQLTPNSPSSRQVVTIPTEAVIERMGLKGVFVASDGEAEFQQITTGQRQAGQVEVFSGLSPGDQVIVEPITEVRAGMTITLRP